MITMGITARVMNSARPTDRMLSRAHLFRPHPATQLGAGRPHNRRRSTALMVMALSFRFRRGSRQQNQQVNTVARLSDIGSSSTSD